jgi:CxxC motif-containing protein (DUF1111 family)
MTVYRKLVTVSLILPASLLLASCARDGGAEGQTNESDPATEIVIQAEAQVAGLAAPTEAPAGFDNLTNGFLTQEEFEAAEEGFDEHEAPDDGLGPLFNAGGCGECHGNPTIGGGAATSELRAGHFNGVNFVDAPGGSLINDRAIDARIQERVPAGNEVRAFRISLSLFGDGFVECVDSNTLAAIANAQPAAQRGTLIQVPVNEAGNRPRAGRFGHKNQHASLISFAADAYVNEMGITSVLQPVENTSLGNSVAAFDAVPDPEDTSDAEHPFGEDLQNFIDLMRALKAPPRDTAAAATASAQRGEALFTSVGCAVCHTPTMVTVPAGTVVNQGAFECPSALGDKIIHPFGDFLMHNIGTGDGIVQNGGQGTRNQIRTIPLWGLRARNRLMHDGLSVTRTDAIQRHGGQASASRTNFNRLSAGSQQDLVNFLNTL